MDFPVCPSCRQSVIDDDAEDCPFCGASMKGKPGSKPAAVAAKPAAASKTQSPKTAPGKQTLPADDFPFEAELNTGKSAIPAMPNPSKQRTLQVVCPMCDTAGYVPPTAAGQDVRCANPKCVMPVFTAPAPKQKEEAPPPPPPPPKSNNLVFISGATVLIVSAIGAGLYFISSLPSNQAPAPKGLSAEDMAELGLVKNKDGGKQSTKSTTDPNIKKAAENADSVTVGAPKLAADELIKSALQQMKDACLQSKQQRSKPFCRQLTAEANIVTGNLKAAEENLEQLRKVGSDVPYYRITPLLEIFWVDFGASNKKSAIESLNLALAELSKTPKSGRTRLEFAGRLAAAMAAAGQMDEASKLLKEYHADNADAQLAARLQIATDGRVARLSNWYSVLPWKFPMAVAATASLMARGQSETAAVWAAGQPNEDAKAECLAFWAEDFAYRKAEQGTADADGKIEAAVNSLPPVLAARVWARAGCGRWLAKDQAGAAAAMNLAKAKLAEVPAPAECKMPVLKSTESFNVPEPDPLLQVATAASEIAFLQAQSASTKADAENSIDIAMTFLDAMAPSYSAAFERHNEAERMPPANLRKLLKKELNKRNDDDAQIACNSYKRKLKEILKASQHRFEIETEVLSRLRGAGVGLDTKVWIIVNSRTTSDDLDRRENFMATRLPGELVEGLKGTAEAQALLATWKNIAGSDAPPRPPAVVFNEMLQTDVPSAVEFVQTVETKDNRQEEILLQISSRLPSANKLQLAFQFIARLPSREMREDCYLLAAAQGARQGQADAVLKQAANVNEATEKVALCRGMIAGLQAIERRKHDLAELR